MRQANERFCECFAHMEELSRERGISLNGLSVEELDALWEEAKAALTDGRARGLEAPPARVL